MSKQLKTFLKDMYLIINRYQNTRRITINDKPATKLEAQNLLREVSQGQNVIFAVSKNQNTIAISAI